MRTKRYEGLFILNTQTREEGVKEIIDRLSAEITKEGGKVETVQKMDKRAFARITDRNVSGAHYVNVIFEIAPGSITALLHHFKLSEDVYRVTITMAPPPKEPAVASATASSTVTAR